MTFIPYKHIHLCELELMHSRSYLHTCLQNVMTVCAHQSNTNDQIRNLGSFTALNLTRY